MDRCEPWSPNIFPPGQEPEWVVGYEMTNAGWKAMDAAREAECIQEGLDSIEREGGIPHEQVMAELRARFGARLAASAK